MEVYSATLEVDGIVVFQLNSLVERPEPEDVTIMINPYRSWKGWEFTTPSHTWCVNNGGKVTKDSVATLTVEVTE